MSKLKVLFLMCIAAVIVAPAQSTYFRTLASFDGTDGSQPYAGKLVQAADGNFYGTTYAGGASNDGTIFKISPSGTVTTLHSFAGYPGDGSFPLMG